MSTSAPTARGPNAEEPRTVTVHGQASGFAQEISVGRHRLAGDEPGADGGSDFGARTLWKGPASGRWP